MHILRTLLTCISVFARVQDKFLFFAIVGDLFPGMALEESPSSDLWSAISEVLQDGALIPVPDFIDKAVEMFETMRIRFGVLALGPSGGGKTTMTHALRQATSNLHARGSENPVSFALCRCL